MTSSLPNEEIQQLVPLLGSLARLVAGGSQLNDGELRTLLLGADLEYDPAILKELKLWSRLLKALHEQPLPELRLVTVESLLLRGLPEAPVLLAVDTVTSGTNRPLAPSLAASSLRVIPSRLDFGVLAPGQLAKGEFDIEGGPGRVIVESDQLRVAPVQFESGTTRVKVEAKPLSGGLLWTSLKLVTSGETLEVPVLAQWTDTVATGSFQQPVAPLAVPLQQTTNPQHSADLTSMIEQAMGISQDQENDIKSLDKFTAQARKVLSFAQEEARRFQHNFIGTEHLLLGLIREGDGIAAKVLSDLGVELNKIRSAIEFIIGRGDHVIPGEPGLTPRARKVIELAADEAGRLNHHYIGSEHLLLGLVSEGEGIAAGVLESLGIRLEKVRTQTIQVLSSTTNNRGGNRANNSQSQMGSSPDAEILEQLHRFFD